MITKGLLVLLLEVFNEQDPQSIQEAYLYFLDSIGLRSKLSLFRANGLASICQKDKKISEK